jgi:hypothetical protein
MLPVKKLEPVLESDNTAELVASHIDGSNIGSSDLRQQQHNHDKLLMDKKLNKNTSPD